MSNTKQNLCHPVGSARDRASRVASGACRCPRVQETRATGTSMQVSGHAQPCSEPVGSPKHASHRAWRAPGFSAASGGPAVALPAAAWFRPRSRGPELEVAGAGDSGPGRGPEQEVAGAGDSGPGWGQSLSCGCAGARAGPGLRGAAWSGPGLAGPRAGQGALPGCPGGLGFGVEGPCWRLPGSEAPAAAPSSGSGPRSARSAPRIPCAQCPAALHSEERGG